MFFYISLFIASIMAAFLALYLFNLIVDAGRAIHKTWLPSSKQNPTNHIRRVQYSAATDTSTPWGWGGHATPSGTARKNPAKPASKMSWGRGGEVREDNTAGSETGLNAFLENSTHQNTDATEKPTVGWPYRSEKKEVAGRAYKVTRKVTTQKSNLRNAKKPWGW